VRQVVVVGTVFVIWGLWKIRNKACFQHVYPVDPNGVIVLIFLDRFTEEKSSKVPNNRSQTSAAGGF
jgi:hypothetical protein